MRVCGKALVRMGVKLEQRIETQELNAGPAKDLCPWNSREHGFHDALSSLVAIANW